MACSKHLTDHQRDLLQTLREAQQAADPDARFILRPIDRWPFVWISHPGLKQSVIVADVDDVLALERAGFFKPHSSMANPPKHGSVGFTRGQTLYGLRPHDDLSIRPENGHDDVQERRER